MVMARFQLVAATALLGLIPTSAAAPPSLDLLASDWQPVLTPVYGAASLTNSWASLLVSTSNVAGFNAFVLTPYSQGWRAAVDAASLYVNGAAVVPVQSQWTPFSVRRHGSVDLGNGVQLTVLSEIRMVFESPAVMLQVNISSATPLAETLLVTMDFSTPTRYYPRADACPSWHYPTDTHPCCWNWFPPEPTAASAASAFSYAWTGAADASWLGIADALSPARGAYAFPAAALGESAGPPTVTNGNVGAWAVPPAQAAVDFAIQAVYVVLNTTTGDAGAAAAAVAAAFSTAWLDAAADWQARFDAALTPGNGHYSGSLPLLSAPAALNASDGATSLSSPLQAPIPRSLSAHASAMIARNRDRVGASAGALSALESAYYMSIASLLANERTNLASLPSQLPGGACSVNEDGSAIQQRLRLGQRLEAHSPKAAADLMAREAAAPAWAAPASARCSAADAAAAPPPAALGSVHRYLPPACGSSAPAPADGPPRARRPFRASRDLRNPYVAAAELPSQRNVFVTGGMMNATTNSFYWDYSYSPVAFALLDPEWLTRNLLLWVSSIDPDSGEPSQWAFWGFEYASARGIGNYYSANDMSLFVNLAGYLAVSGDLAFLNHTVVVGPYPNGTFANTTVYDTALALATHWTAAAYNASAPGAHGLADYGLAPNLLECVPTYIHRVAGFNAANAWMMNAFAELAEAARGDAALAAQLRALADAVAAAVQLLYVPPAAACAGAAAASSPAADAPPTQLATGGAASAAAAAAAADGGGYFNALYPNGTLQQVRHVIDFVYVTLSLGVQRSNATASAASRGGQGAFLSSPSTSAAAAAASAASSGGYIPAAMAADMGAFVRRELLAPPHWMRALSLLDPAAPLSNRSDHGPSGAYTGWPPLVIRSLGMAGDYATAMAFLADSAWVTSLGPYGQAVEVRPPGLPYKPMAVTLYNELAGTSFADCIIQTAFGYQPPLVSGGGGSDIDAPPPPPLADPGVPRGFTGTLSSVWWHGSLLGIASDGSGLRWV